LDFQSAFVRAGGLPNVPPNIKHLALCGTAVRYTYYTR
jgi:hypothetical protein